MHIVRINFNQLRARSNSLRYYYIYNIKSLKFDFNSTRVPSLNFAPRVVCVRILRTRACDVTIPDCHNNECTENFNINKANRRLLSSDVPSLDCSGVSCCCKNSFLSASLYGAWCFSLRGTIYINWTNFSCSLCVCVCFYVGMYYSGRG